MKIKILFAAILLTNTCLAATTMEPGAADAYGANIGWVNAEADTANGAVIGQAFCSGYLYGANVGWIELGDGDPDDHIAYGNGSATDFGVNHDGQGGLTGYAYGANIGWINFEQTRGQPKVNLETGDLSGYVWGANIGWINLSDLTTLTIDSGPDTDSDCIPDSWEYGHTNVLTVLDDGGVDSDGDGVLDTDEYGGDTNPFDDTDYLAITDFEIDGSTNRVTWTCTPTREYTLQVAVALRNGIMWADTGSKFVPSSGPDIAEMVTGVCDTNRFYRVQARPPLSP